MCFILIFSIVKYLVLRNDVSCDCGESSQRSIISALCVKFYLQSNLFSPQDCFHAFVSY